MTSPTPSPRNGESPDFIVALDVSSSAELPAILDRLDGIASWYKLGLEVFSAEGPACLDPLHARNARIFLDLKFHDIPRTVERAVASACRHGIHLLTVHASGGRAILTAAATAARAAGTHRPRILAVTALTSLDTNDFADLGIARTLDEQVLSLAKMAVECGIDGLVCSPQEVGRLRRELGPGPLLVTPGIRLPTDQAGDQKRTGTPADAIRDGASYLVVGRPILEAADPAAAARAIRAEIARGLGND